MPDGRTISLFFTSALALLVVPGPATTYIIARALQQGRRGGLLAVLGVGCGTFCHVLLAAAGVAAALKAAPAAFQAVRYAGAGYMFWLGLRALLSRPACSAGTHVGAPGRHAFMQAVLTNLLNPRTALFCLAFLPQFVRPERGHAGLQTAGWGVALISLGFLTDGCYALAAGSAAARLRTDARWQAGLDRLAGITFLVLALAALLPLR